MQERTSSNTLGASLLTGGIDELFSRSADGATQSFLTDALGSTLRLTDGAGAKVVDYSYEAYGKASNDNAASTNTFQYTGRENDGTNLQFNRARYYDPRLGRFISEDPIGLAGGLNTYAYANGAPTMYTDPLGLWSVEGGVYIGIGASVGLGRDPNTGGTFMNFKFGKGFGWGATYDPLGGRAGGAEDQSCRAGVGVGLYAEAGGTAGPISGKVEANIGRNFFFGGGNDLYGGVQPKGSVDTNIRGVKGVAATGIEITVFGSRPSR